MLQRFGNFLQKNSTFRTIKKYGSSIIEATSKESGEEEQQWEKWWEGSVRSHPGVCNLQAIRLPEALDKNASLFLKQSDTSRIKISMQKLMDILWSRDVPIKHKENKNENFERHLWIKKLIKNEKEKPNLTNWKPIFYDELITAIYLVARTPGSFVATTRVLNEIKLLNPNFAPNDMLDFGSGSGSSVWAANQLWPNIKDFYCIEPSTEMNSVANFLHSGNKENVEFMGIHIRKEFKAYFQKQYDIVHCAFVLSDISSKKERMQIIKKLWEKTSKYLIVIEYGTTAGYSLVMEARQCVSEQKNAKTFSPCPHEEPCPMKSTTCNFTQKYFIPNYARNFHDKSKIIAFEKFSFVVLERLGESSSDIHNTKRDWARVIRNPNQSKHCVECHLCTTKGEIEHIQIQKQKHGTQLHQLARVCEAGDMFPIHK